MTTFSSFTLSLSSSFVYDNRQQLLGSTGPNRPKIEERLSMKTKFILLFIFAIYFSLPTYAGNTNFPGTEEGAKQLLHDFLKAETNHISLSATLQPTKKDYQAYFVSGAAEKAEQAYTPLWKQMPLVIKPKSGQTELLLFKATTDELKKGGQAAYHFPGGYKQIADKLKSGNTVYRFKFVKPGEKLGMAYDGLTYINGHWVIFPKPWRVLK